MAKIFGQLEKAQAENTTSDNANDPKGMLKYRTDTNVLKVSNGTSYKEQVDTDSTQTLSNKTLTAPTSNNGTFNTPALNNPSIADYADFEEQGSSPANPSAGFRRFYMKSDGNFYTRDSSGNEQLVGSGGSGGINYIDNGRAETNTTGWSTYADAADTSPVDGTGGAANITFTRSTSSPLRDAASFLLTKDAANRQGQGVSYDFTIDDADKAQVLRITADYAVSSGTFSYGDGTVASPSDIRVFIYDVGNSAIIEPTETLLNGSGRIVTEFQSASNSTSYRLIFHVATTSASAWELKLDNIQVGPRELARGPIITDWAAFTPTANDNTNVTYTGFWRRVGDSMEIDLEAKYTGLGGNVSLTFTMPFGLSVDYNKLTDDTDGVGVAGIGTFFDASAVASANQFQAGILLRSSASPTSLRFAIFTADDWKQFNPASVPVATASGDIFTVKFKVPIVGWASNTVMSSDSGTRVIGFSIVSNLPTVSAYDATANVIYSGTNSTFIDTHAAWNTSTGVYTAPESGWYFIGARTGIAGTEALNDTVTTQIFVNGSRVATGLTRVEAAGTSGTYASVTHVAYLAAGSTIAQRVTTSISGGALVSSTDAHALQIFKIQSPQSIGMADKHSARYSTDSGQSVASSTITIINYEDKSWDTHGSVTIGASWKWTANRIGIAKVSASASFAGNTFNAGDIVDLYIYKNGVEQSRNRREFETTATLTNTHTIVDSVYVVAGDYIDIRIRQTNASSRNITGGVECFVAIDLE